MSFSSVESNSTASISTSISDSISSPDTQSDNAMPLPAHVHLPALTAAVHAATPVDAQPSLEQQQQQKKQEPSGIKLRFKKKALSTVNVAVELNAKKPAEGQVVGSMLPVEDDGARGRAADSPGPGLSSSVEAMSLDVTVPVAVAVPAVESLQESLQESLVETGETKSKSDVSGVGGKAETKCGLGGSALGQSVSTENDEILDGMVFLHVVGGEELQSKTAPKAGVKTEGKRPAVFKDTSHETQDGPAKRICLEIEKDEKRGLAIEGHAEGTGPAQAKPKVKARRPAKRNAAVACAAASITDSVTDVPKTEITTNQASTTTTATTNTITIATPIPTPNLPPPTPKSTTQILHTLNHVLIPFPKLQSDLKTYYTRMSGDLKGAQKTITTLQKELAALTQKLAQREERAKEDEKAARDTVVFWTDCWVEEWGKRVVDAEGRRGVERDLYCRGGEGGLALRFSADLGRGTGSADKGKGATSGEVNEGERKEDEHEVECDEEKEEMFDHSARHVDDGGLTFCFTG